MQFVQSEARDNVNARFYKIPSSQLRSFYYKAVFWHRALCIAADMGRCCKEIWCIHHHGTCVQTALHSITTFILTYMVIMFVKFSPLWHIILKWYPYWLQQQQILLVPSIQAKYFGHYWPPSNNKKWGLTSFKRKEFTIAQNYIR